MWGLTLEMSGGLKGAKQPLERPLDRRVRLRLGWTKADLCRVACEDCEESPKRSKAKRGCADKGYSAMTGHVQESLVKRCSKPQTFAASEARQRRRDGA